MKIRKYNVPAHIDIETHLERRMKGNVTFTVRVNAGNIVDLSIVNYVDTRKKYPASKRDIKEKLEISSPIRERSTVSSIRYDNIQPFSQRQKSIVGFVERSFEPEKKV